MFYYYRSMILSVKQWNFELGGPESRISHNFTQTQLHRIIQFQERLDPYYYLHYHYVCEFASDMAKKVYF